MMRGKGTSALISIGGRRLAMKDKGEGVPTIVLEMGLGVPGSFYDDIAEQIATSTRVVWYDRAGLGQSDPAVIPRTIQDIVLDLHALLHNARIPGPSVFVGHSMGGLTVRYYRECYPEEVAAIVLIDSSHEDQRQRTLAVLPPECEREHSHLAHLRHILRVRWEDPNKNEEKIDNLANSKLMRNCGMLGDLPLTVISRGHSDRNPEKFPPGVVEQIEQVWQQMQYELAQLSSQSRYIRAENSGHMINKDEPDLIVEVIRQVVMQIREKMEN
jgi:pimeloyl-ACP methyl ester carboxylesterase